MLLLEENSITKCMSFSANGTYGKYKHTLNADEMPNHAHNIPALNYEYKEVVQQE